MDKHSLRRNPNATITSTTLTLAQLRSLVNVYISNNRPELIREEVRQLLTLVIDSIETIINTPTTLFSATITAPNGTIAVPANTIVSPMIIQSATTQVILIGSTVGGGEDIPFLPVTAGVDQAVNTVLWRATASNIHITCTNDITVIYQLNSLA